MALRLRRGNWKRGVLVNPLGGRDIGRHTGKNVKEGKNIRVTDDGYECFDDYFSASEAESTLEITLHKSLRSSKNNRGVLSDVESNVTTAVSRKKKKRSPSLRLGRDIGWRTLRNVREGKNIRKDASGFEIFDDYFSDTEAESSLSSLSITTGLQSLTSKTIDNDITNGENEVDENGEQRQDEDDLEPAAEPNVDHKNGEEGIQKSMLDGDPNEKCISIVDEEDKSVEDEEDISIKHEEDKLVDDEEDKSVKNDEETNVEETDDKNQSVVSTKSQKDETFTEQDLTDSDQPETNHSQTDEDVQFMDDERRDYLRRKSRSEKTINVSSVSLKDGDNYSYREYQTILKSSRKSNFVKLSQTLPSVISYFPDGTPSVDDDPDNVTDIVVKDQTLLSVAAEEQTHESAVTREMIQTQSGINTGGELTGSITKDDAAKKSSPINSFKTKKRLSYSGESFIESTNDNLNQSKYRNKQTNKSNLVCLEEDVILDQSAFHQQVEDPQQSDDTENLYVVDQREPNQVYHLDELPRNGPRRGRSFDKIPKKIQQSRKSEFNGTNVSISVVDEIHKNLQILNQASSADRSFNKGRSKNSDSIGNISSRSLRKSTRNSSKNSISINGNNEELSDSKLSNNHTVNKSRNVTKLGTLIYDDLDSSSSDTNNKIEHLNKAVDEVSQTTLDRSHVSRLSKRNSSKLNKSGSVIDKSKIDACEHAVNGLDDVSQLETTNRSLRSSNRTLSKSNNSKSNKSLHNNSKSIVSSEMCLSENGVSQFVNKTLQKTLADKDTSTSGLPSGSSTKNRKSTKEIETNTTPMDLTDVKTLNNETRKRQSNDESDLGVSDKMKKLSSDKENISNISEDSVITSKSHRRTVVIDDDSDVVPSESVYCQSQDMSIQELDGGHLPASIAESTRIDESFLRKIPLDTPKSGVSIRHRRFTAGRLSAINSLHRTAIENNQM
ncbi:uncharacterized protein DDB_G0286591-like [Patella vulgata]|uniref:uncharacterized protein DDB_G0286591-like n=1 Tax=Patella vulgata TaxID=6465 RepID=UPI0024A97F29|nr:uncharacterized protein DDB_G0286591-like [Patella vulgata]